VSEKIVRLNEEVIKGQQEVHQYEPSGSGSIAGLLSCSESASLFAQDLDTTPIDEVFRTQVILLSEYFCTLKMVDENEIMICAAGISQFLAEEYLPVQPSLHWMLRFPLPWQHWTVPQRKLVTGPA